MQSAGKLQSRINTTKCSAVLSSVCILLAGCGQVIVRSNSSLGMNPAQASQIIWEQPPAIVYGTALSATQLDATANVPGTLSYTPSLGTVLGAGLNTLSVTFTPDDAINYSAAEASTTLFVTGSPNHLFVATNGNDSWSCMFDAPTGNGDGPCATVDHARALIAASLSQMDGSTQAFTVQIRGGTYYLSSPIIFSPADSAGPGYTVTYEAYPNETPIISGGVQLKDWTDNGAQWQIVLPDVLAGAWNFTQLWVSDSRRFRPMLPSISTYYHVVSAPSHEPYQSFDFKPGDISDSWANLTDVDITVFSYWTALTSPIQSVVGDTVNLSNQTSFYSPIYWGGRYRIENVKEALGQPGQWYLDRPTGVLTYTPENGEQPDSLVIVAPRLTNLIIFSRGSANITLRGLTFAHTQWLPPLPNFRSGLTNGEGDDAAIMGIGISNITIDGCVLRNTGNGGIYFGPGTTHTSVKNSILGDIGATGISFSNHFGSRSFPNILSPYDSYQVGSAPMTHNSVINNLIQGVGRMNPAGQGVRLEYTNSYGRIQNNEILDTYQVGITMGQDLYETPAQQDSLTRNNIVTLNLIYDIGQSVTSDLGGIYAAGLQPGTVISKNIIHDVSALDYGGWGLYVDQGAMNLTWQQNVVWNTTDGCIYFNPGMGSIIQDNIFVNCSQITEAAQLARGMTPTNEAQQDTSGVIRGVDSPSTWGTPFYTFRRNIVAWGSDDPLVNMIVPGETAAAAIASGPIQQDDNVYWNTGNVASGKGCIGGSSAAANAVGNCFWNLAGKEEYVEPAVSWNQWAAFGYDLDSQWADPNLSGASTFYSTQNTSVLPTGFQDWDHTLVGRTSGAGGVRGGTLPFPIPVAAYH